MAFFKHKQSPEIPRRRQEQLVRSDDPTDTLSSDVRRHSYVRNRTLSGPSGRPSPGNTDMSDRAQVHRLTHQRRRLGGIFFIVLLGVIVLGGLLSQLTAKVAVSVADTDISKPLDASTYQQAINDYLDSHPIERLRFVLNERSMTAYISERLPEVAAISGGSFRGIGESSFVLELRRPVAGWRLGDRQFYVDDKGVAFENNYFSNPSVQIVDQSGVSLNDGGAITSIRFLEFVGRVVALNQAAGMTVTEAILPTETTRQLHIRLKDNPTIIRLSIDRGAGEQVEDATRSLRYLTANKVVAEYVDVRIAGKAYYK